MKSGSGDIKRIGDGGEIPPHGGAAVVQTDSDVSAADSTAYVPPAAQPLSLAKIVGMATDRLRALFARPPVAAPAVPPLESFVEYRAQNGAAVSIKREENGILATSSSAHDLAVFVRIMLQDHPLEDTLWEQMTPTIGYLANVIRSSAEDDTLVLNGGGITVEPHYNAESRRFEVIILPDDNLQADVEIQDSVLKLAVQNFLAKEKRVIEESVVPHGLRLTVGDIVAAFNRLFDSSDRIKSDDVIRMLNVADELTDYPLPGGVLHVDVGIRLSRDGIAEEILVRFVEGVYERGSRSPGVTGVYTWVGRPAVHSQAGVDGPSQLSIIYWRMFATSFSSLEDVQTRHLTILGSRPAESEGVFDIGRHVITHFPDPVYTMKVPLGVSDISTEILARISERHCTFEDLCKIFQVEGTMSGAHFRYRSTFAAWLISIMETVPQPDLVRDLKAMLVELSADRGLQGLSLGILKALTLHGGEWRDVSQLRTLLAELEGYARNDTMGADALMDRGRLAHFGGRMVREDLFHGILYEMAARIGHSRDVTRPRPEKFSTRLNDVNQSYPGLAKARRVFGQEARTVRFADSNLDFWRFLFEEIGITVNPDTMLICPYSLTWGGRVFRELAELANQRVPTPQGYILTDSRRQVWDLATKVTETLTAGGGFDSNPQGGGVGGRNIQPWTPPISSSLGPVQGVLNPFSLAPFPTMVGLMGGLVLCR